MRRAIINIFVMLCGVVCAVWTSSGQVVINHRRDGAWAGDLPGVMGPGCGQLLAGVPQGRHLSPHLHKEVKSCFYFLFYW